MFQEEFIELLKHMASTTVKDIFGCEFRPPCQGGKTTGKGPMGPWVAGSDETGALDPAARIRVNLRTEDGGEVLLEIATVKAWLIEGMLL
jgi:hypothetical protein